MKKQFLSLVITTFSLSSSHLSAEDIIEEALKVTPLGFTDQAPVFLKHDPMVDLNAGSTLIPSDLARIVYLANPVSNNLWDISHGGDDWDGLSRYQDLMNGSPYHWLVEWPTMTFPFYPELDHLPNSQDFGIPVIPDDEQFNDHAPRWKFPPVDLIPLFLESA